MHVKVALALFANIQAASAHAIFTQLNGNPIGHAIRISSSNSPLTDVTANSITCNGSPNPIATSSDTITIAAGLPVAVTWRHESTSGPHDVIDPSHKGPVIAYMKKVVDATTDPGHGDGWFKVQEDGFGEGAWGVDRLIASGGVQTIQIPSCIAPGQYLLRAEIIALHSASALQGAQFFIACAQVNVVAGSGTKIPTTVRLPGTYNATDPGLLINIYYPPITNYTIPGPNMLTC